MKAIHWITAALGLTFIVPAVADAATSDPDVTIYRFSGVRDTGSAPLTALATVFHCTNFSGETQNIRLVTRRTDGILLSNLIFGLDHLATLTVTTHSSSAHVQDAPRLTGAVSQVMTAIAATSTNIICKAMTIDAATATRGPAGNLLNKTIIQISHPATKSVFTHFIAAYINNSLHTGPLVQERPPLPQPPLTSYAWR